MPAQYVKPYVKPGKNDAANADAICEAVTRPTMALLSACLGRQSKGALSASKPLTSKPR